VVADPQDTAWASLPVHTEAWLEKWATHPQEVATWVIAVEGLED